MKNPEVFVKSLSGCPLLEHVVSCISGHEDIEKEYFLAFAQLNIVLEISVKFNHYTDQMDAIFILLGPKIKEVELNVY